ncbi:MAG: [FeFe] hydrogenase H-cluster maturation GTPase HydF [Bacillota bacterium]|nr:[FeFe] hydrogenase H-cluster maturation GTPase HydF [Bacillota bacterium]
MSLNDTPRANRLHIGIFGKRNSGKSSLINALTGQDIALVSEMPGTTTDPVLKSMELHPIGPVVFIDTAGFDDEGRLGKLRVERTESVIDKTDVAIMVVDGTSMERALEPEGCLVEELSKEKQWLEALRKKKVPVILAVNKWGEAGGSRLPSELLTTLHGILGDLTMIAVSAKTGAGLDQLRSAIQQEVPEDFLREQILGDMIQPDGLALLVMPQDIQAPKGRLILPQVQTLRELLDRKCTAVATTADGLEKALNALNKAPDLIITDSQCFDLVYRKKPEESRLTSFSVLFAAYKGDISAFTEGASVLDDMTEKSRVLIAEACTHVPLSEDIGREKIPNLLHKKFGDGLEIVNVCGNDFPKEEQLKEFDLVIHCGACMFNRKHVLNRIEAARQAGVPITNYGVVLAKLAGILDKIQLPADRTDR